MLLKRIIPCLDVDKGRVVKGVRYVDHVDAGDPVEVARLYDLQEADEITFLDITASVDGRDTTLHTVERMASQVFIPLTVGGGVRTVQDIRNLLNAGADKVSINTAAVERPDLVKEAAERFGTQCIVVAIDAKRAAVPNAWEVFTHGGRKPTGINVVEWADRMEQYGAGEILLTSMDEDGQQRGYDLGLTAAVAQRVSVPVIASGVLVPLIIKPFGVNPAMAAIITLTAGSSGTLMTPMAANFNIVPAALLNMRDQYGVIKFQLPYALTIWSFHVLLLWLLIKVS